MWFQEFTKLERGSVLLSDNKAYKITEIGTIKFHLHDETERVLEEVRILPNLISLLDKKGHVFKGEKGVLKALRESMIVMKNMRKNDLHCFRRCCNV